MFTKVNEKGWLRISEVLHTIDIGEKSLSWTKSDLGFESSRLVS